MLRQQVSFLIKIYVFILFIYNCKVQLCRLDLINNKRKIVEVDNLVLGREIHVDNAVIIMVKVMERYMYQKLGTITSKVPTKIKSNVMRDCFSRYFLMCMFSCHGRHTKMIFIFIFEGI